MSSKKYVILRIWTALVFLSLFSGWSFSATLIWQGGDWNVAANWDIGRLPSASDKVKLGYDRHGTLSSAANVSEIRIADAVSGNISTEMQILNGASLITPRLYIGTASNTGGSVVCNGGTALISTLLVVGNNSSSSGNLVLQDDGNTQTNLPQLSVTGTLIIGLAGNGNIELREGNITTGSLNMKTNASATARLNVENGTLAINNSADQTAMLQGFIDNGYIVAYNNNPKAQLFINYNSVAGTTTLGVTVTNQNDISWNPMPAAKSTTLDATRREN